MANIKLNRKSEGAYQYASISRKVPQGLGAAKVALQKFLRSIDNVGWSRREETGRVDRRAFTRYACGESSIFSRREYTEATKSAVSVLIDLSGSTFDKFDKRDGRAIVHIFQEVAIHLSNLLRDCKVDYAITGFHGRATYDTELRIVLEDVTFTEIKGWGDNPVNVGPVLGRLPDLVAGSTPDYSALRLSIEELSKLPHQRKVLFILTDADGYNPSRIQQLERVAEKLGIVIVAIGVGATPVETCFRYARNVKSAADAFSASFGTLLKSIGGRNAAQVSTAT